MQLVTVGLLDSLYIPPPKPDPVPPPYLAVLPLKVQLVTVGLLLERLYIPPPRLSAVFPLKVQLLTAGLLDSLDIPPP